MRVKESVQMRPEFLADSSGEVWDGRLVVAQMTGPETGSEYEFGSEPMPLPFDSSVPYPPIKRSKGTVYGLTQHEYAGSDGELSSGFMEVVEVHGSTDETRAVIRSWQFSHDNGIPVFGASWICGFTDVDAARAVWSYGPRFFLSDMEKQIQEAAKGEPTLPERVTGFRNMGMLTPRFYQKAGEMGITLGDIFIKPDDFTSSEILGDKLEPGRVYRLPTTEWHSVRPIGYHAKTLVSANDTKWRSDAFGGYKEAVVVQWLDGTMQVFDPVKEETIPQPLKATQVRPRLKKR